VTAFVSVLISPYAADILYAIRIRRKGRGLPLCKGMSDIGPGLRISIVEVASEAALVWCVTSLQEMELPYNPVLTNE
jgi:hypothetical protein